MIWKSTKTWTDFVWKPYVSCHGKYLLLLNHSSCHKQKSLLEVMHSVGANAEKVRHDYTFFAAVWCCCNEVAQAESSKVLDGPEDKHLYKARFQLVAVSSGRKRSIAVNTQCVECYFCEVHLDHVWLNWLFRNEVKTSAGILLRQPSLFSKWTEDRQCSRPWHCWCQ